VRIHSLSFSEVMTGLERERERNVQWMQRLLCDSNEGWLGPRSEEIMVSIVAKSCEHHLKVSRFNTSQLTF